MKLSLGYITCPTKAEAKKIVLALLEDGLIACANILEGSESYYVWDNEIQKGKEAIVFIKTRRKNETAITRLVKEMHSYVCPCVLFTSIENGHGEFLKWIYKES